MDVDINRGVLVDLVRELNEKIDENTRAVRATNILLLGAAMNLDVTEPVARAKVLRHLDGVQAND